MATAEDEIPGGVITGLVAVSQAVVVSLIIAIGSQDTGVHNPAAYLFAAGFGAVLLFRRRFPTAVLVLAILGVFVYYAFDHPPIGMAVPVVGAFYSAVERGRVAVPACAGVVLLAVALFFRIHDGEPSSVLAYDVITNTALIGCAIALGIAVRSRRAIRDQQDRVVSLERDRQQERAARQLESQRLHMARDVHDSVGHALSLVAVQARVAQQAIGADDSAVANAIDSVVATSQASLADLRRTLAILQSERETVQDAPLSLSGIERIAQAARDTGLEVEVHMNLDDRAVPAPAAGTGYRIVQESVTNVLRHARARHVVITVDSDGDCLRLQVSDDGVGSDAEQGHGQGLAGMRERAALLGGTVTAGPSASGFMVTAALPMGKST